MTHLDGYSKSHRSLPSSIQIPEHHLERDTRPPHPKRRRTLLALQSKQCRKSPNLDSLPQRYSPTIESAYLLLQKVFKQKSFRSPQEQIIVSALKNEDILVILPTGRGKSLTYQLPAIVHPEGLTIVISPLLSLIADQVNKLVSLGVAAEALNSTTPVEHQTRIINDLKNVSSGPATRLIYVSPERCAQDSFRKILTRLVEHKKLNRFVIDEAHCCVEYGFDFRPDFLKLGDLKQLFPHIPITALTATAPKRMREDIISVLNLPQIPQLKVYTASVNRANLHYEVRFIGSDSEPDHILLDIIQFLKGYKRARQSMTRDSPPSFGAGVIYCRRKIAVQELSRQLQAHGFGAHAYHADKSNQEKNTILHNFVHNENGYEIVVATTAFGMGVDKPDVRFVIHYDMPNTMEAYYQESGRAGRDGRGARCILYYSREDGVNLAKLRQLRQKKPAHRQDSLVQQRDNENNSTEAGEADDEPVGGPGYDALVKYCESTVQCRHLRISRYFDPESTPLKPTRDWCHYACDYCKDPIGLKKRQKALTPLDGDL